jgi:hypothetical protein
MGYLSNIPVVDICFQVPTTVGEDVIYRDSEDGIYGKKKKGLTNH